MKFNPVIMLVFSCIATSGAGAQTSALARATLSSPVAKTDAIVVNDLPWQCDGQTCSGASGGGRFDDQRSCRDVAQKIGLVAAFESARGALTPENLARCNRYARSSH